MQSKIKCAQQIPVVIKMWLPLYHKKISKWVWRIISSSWGIYQKVQNFSVSLDKDCNDSVKAIPKELWNSFKSIGMSNKTKVLNFKGTLMQIWKSP